MVALIPKGIFKFKETTIKGKKTFVPWEMKNILADEWKEITGDSFILDVRRIERHSLDPVTGEIGNHDRLRALVEVFKYALKMNDMDIAVQVSSYESLKHRRLIGSFGSLRGVKVSKELNDMPLDDSELPYIDLMYQYSGVTYGYQEIFRGQFDLEPRVKQTEEKFADFEKRLKKARRHKEEKRQQAYSALSDQIKAKHGVKRGSDLSGRKNGELPEEEKNKIIDIIHYKEIEIPQPDGSVVIAKELVVDDSFEGSNVVPF
jgi:hypothetical protein